MDKHAMFIFGVYTVVIIQNITRTKVHVLTLYLCVDLGIKAINYFTHKISKVTSKYLVGFVNDK